MVETLHAYGVRYVFGVPGAKIDPVFDALLDSGAELVVCRHEQNAAHAMWDPSTSLCARLGSWRLLVRGQGKVAPLRPQHYYRLIITLRGS
ncbi:MULTISPECIES: thiamine pyrophosphate-binding protein [Mycobacterium avium complex (MAC)]|uniref:thiamine pyrophosphate-binding protein n=1 Tax=Mycobacterium avium complex (MAC) TaxID=120793 RepID=UPI001CC3B4D7|nr:MULTISPECIES: thiamine pyrophosphate-binding protein [Mycobacterium avium complex (MAC)]MDV3301036.1 hypothetical protein [Mycobacterium avium]